MMSSYNALNPNNQPKNQPNINPKTNARTIPKTKLNINLQTPCSNPAKILNHFQVEVQIPKTPQRMKEKCVQISCEPPIKRCALE
jgi:hypothetical protein